MFNAIISKSMKKIRQISFVLFGCALFMMSYLVYSGKMMLAQTPQQELLFANLEALTRGEPGPGGGPYCHAGGPGASQCSIDAGINIAGYGVSGGCSVTCGSGTYACCTLRCTCV